MVTKLHEHLAVPVTCKIRRFDDLQRTLDYARMIERSGCQVAMQLGSQPMMSYPDAHAARAHARDEGAADGPGRLELRRASQVWCRIARR